MSIPLVVKLLQVFLPDAHWLLKYAEKDHGWIKFPPIIAQAAVELELHWYVTLYADERCMITCFLLGALGECDTREFFAELPSADLTAADVNELLEADIEVLNAMEELPGSCFRLPKTEAELAAVRAEFLALSPEEQAECVRRAQLFLAAVLALFLQYLSLMVHGEKLTTLVSRALQGDDDAFVKAVQIDRKLLIWHPGFRDRYARAHADGNERFFVDLAYRLGNPIVKGKIRFRLLWITFAVFDAFGLLNGSLSASELLRLIDEIGLDRWENRIEDEQYLRKRLADYRRFQRRGPLSNP